MPKPALLEGWAAQVPDGVPLRAQGVAADHAPQAAEGGGRRGRVLLPDVAATLGDRLGPTLFQLPPNLKKDLPRLEEFLALLPEGRARRLRVPPRLLVRGGRLRGAARARRGALHRRGRGARDASRRDGAAGATCACAARTTATRTVAAWAETRPRPSPGTRPTSSSSTRTPAPGPRLAAQLLARFAPP